MKKKYLLFIVTIICTILITNSCKDKAIVLEEPTITGDQLPPITQSGANTFGCLINGKVFIPKGYANNGTNNPRGIFDIDLNGIPYLQIRANQYENGGNQIGSFTLTIDSINNLGVHNIYTIKKQIGFGSTLFSNCGILPDANSHFKSGSIIITKNTSNNTNGIISGVFNFKLKIPSCDTLFFTDGRFDIKL
jgi:hypothetical protein